LPSVRYHLRIFKWILLFEIDCLCATCFSNIVEFDFSAQTDLTRSADVVEFKFLFDNFFLFRLPNIAGAINNAQEHRKNAHGKSNKNLWYHRKQKEWVDLRNTVDDFHEYWLSSPNGPKRLSISTIDGVLILLFSDKFFTFLIFR